MSSALLIGLSSSSEDLKRELRDMGVLPVRTGLKEVGRNTLLAEVTEGRRSLEVFELEVMKKRKTVR